MSFSEFVQAYNSQPNLLNPYIVNQIFDRPVLSYYDIEKIRPEGQTVLLTLLTLHNNI